MSAIGRIGIEGGAGTGGEIGRGRLIGARLLAPPAPLRDSVVGDAVEGEVPPLFGALAAVGAAEQVAEAAVIDAAGGDAGDVHRATDGGGEPVGMDEAGLAAGFEELVFAEEGPTHGGILEVDAGQTKGVRTWLWAVSLGYRQIVLGV